MLLKNKGEGNGPAYSAGPADVICIISLPGGTFHAAFYEENPISGQVGPVDKLDFIRLKSKMHHIEGAATFEEAQKHLAALRARIELPDANVLDDVPLVLDDPVSVLIVPNWIRENMPLRDALKNWIKNS